MFLNYCVLLCGLTLVGLVMRDVFHGVVVPRWSSRALRISPAFTDKFWRIWRNISYRYQEGDSREDFLGTFAPFALVSLLVCWTVLMVLGYGLCFWALRSEVRPHISNPLEAFYVAGVTVLTIGYGDFVPNGASARALVLVGGASGLAIFALVISLLFTLYSAVERREVLVVSLDARAGSPPSGIALLEIYSELDLLDTLPSFFERWEEWSAQVLQSHIAYPILPFFRSSHERESWIAAMGAVLDAATILLTTVESSPTCGKKPLGAAKLMYRLGTHTIVDLSHWYGYRFEEGQLAVGIERREYDIARRKLEKAGFSLKEAEQAWQDFSVKRGQYARYLNELAKHFAAPPAQWIGDRSILPIHHREPEARQARRQEDPPNLNPPAIEKSALDTI